MARRRVPIACRLVLAAMIGGSVFSIAWGTFVEDDVTFGDTVRSSAGVVVAAHPQAAGVGAALLARGGNAMDAAVGIAFALAVVEPEASGLGGGGFLLFYNASNDTCVSLDYRETAPALSTDTMYSLDSEGLHGTWSGPRTEREQSMLQRYGGRAVAVPRSVIGLLHAQEVYGRLPLADVLEAAIGLAENGYTVSETLYSAVLNVYDVLLSDEAMAAAFLNDYLPYEPGQTAYRPDLAATLREIAASGSAAFYSGAMAEDIVTAVRQAGGILTVADLAATSVAFSEPMEFDYRGFRLLSPPLPSGSLTLLETLSILSAYDFSASQLTSADAIHVIAEAAKRAFADRAAYVGDPAFVSVPASELLSADYAAARRLTISLTDALLLPAAGTLEHGSTTHVSVVDGEGNAVSLTQSIGLFFGSRVFVPEWGILMNDTMADFDPEAGNANSVAAEKKPLSSMCPLLIFDENGLRAVLGTPGGTRITSTLAQLVIALCNQDVALDEAVQLQRFHAEADTLYIESRVTESELSDLESRGHPVEIKRAYDLFFGGAHVIEVLRDEENVMYVGTADPRRAGQAAGL